MARHWQVLHSLDEFAGALLLPVSAVASGVFVLLLCEYALVSLTSSLSLSVRATRIERDGHHARLQERLYRRRFERFWTP